eukprot:GGOE01043302.1.p1 GENE.GGOE01043302.1~~GGOE01043302.1.p1  ORF type:complete len:715 (-),score=227.80 GGOE01043302.1:116-2206(-)
MDYSLSNYTAARTAAHGLSGDAFLLVLATNVLLCGAGTAVWLVAARRLDLYQLKEVQDRCGEPTGLQTALYLLTQRYLIQLVASVCVLANAILLPLHLASGLSSSRTGHVYPLDDWYRASQVSAVSDDPNRLLAHVVVAYSIALAVVGCSLRYISHSRSIDQWPPAACVENFSVRLVGLPRWVTLHDVCDLQRSLREQLGTDTAMLHVAFNVAERVALAQGVRLAERQLWRADALLESRPMSLIHRLCCCDTLHPHDTLREQHSAAVKAVEEWDRQVSADRSLVKCACFAHLTFSSRIEADSVLRRPPLLEFAEAPLRVQRALNPNDLDWAHVGVPAQEQAVRRMVAWGLVTLWLVFFSTPLSVLTGLQALFAQVPMGNDMAEAAAEGNSHAVAFALQYFPALVLLIITWVLPPLVERLTRWERRPSRRAHQRAVGERVFLYLLLSTFLLPSLALSTTKRILDAITGDEATLVVIQQSFIAGDGSFFVNFVIMMLTFGVHSDLWRWTNLFYYLKDAAMLPAAEKFAEQTAFEFPLQMAVMVVVWSVVAGYSLFIPWLPLLGLAYLLLKHTVERHHLRTNLFSSADILDHAGVVETVEVVLLYVIGSLALAQVMLGLYFYFCALALHAFLVFVLLLLTVAAAYQLLCRNRASPMRAVTFDDGPLAATPLHPKGQHAGDRVGSCSYDPPFLSQVANQL